MASPFVEIEVGPRTVKVTNPDKLIFPAVGITKREMVDYYLSVGDGIMRALRERPVTLERWQAGVHEGVKVATRADGRGADAFYQKRISKGAPPWVETAHITFPSGRTADEVCPTELATVAWCAQQNTITFHPWPVRRVDVDHPDELRIDLDPQPGTDFSDAVAVAGGGPRGARRARLARLPEDVGQPGRAHLRADPAALDVHRRPARGDRLRPRAGAADARPGDHEVVEGGARRDDLRRLQPERAGPDDRLGVLGATAAACPGVGAAGVGRAAGRRPARAHGADDAGPVRRAGRRAPRDRRRGARPDAAAGVVRARRARPRPRRHALPAGLSQDAGGADAGAAEPRQEAR